MKPLELIVYPKLERPVWGHQIEGYRQQVRAEIELREAKRLTEAELTAEFHCARADYIEASNHPSGTYWTPLGVDEDATADMAMKRSITSLRFATLPHYDEDTP